jgi:hypothetical protein
MPVIHRQRVAWDGARAFVRAAASPQYPWFASALLQSLGSELYGAFADTRNRLLTALVEAGNDRTASDLEAGKWRVRLEDLLSERPELTEAVLRLTSEARQW